MAQNDRTTGLVGLAGCKVPVKAASTAALAALSGEQTVDGVALVTGDRVLVKDQANAVLNGIYVVDTGDWSRADDCDGSYDLVKGTLIRVNEGTVNGDGLFVVTSADPITIETSSLSFSRLSINYIVTDSRVASAGQTLFNLGITYQLGSANLQVYVNGLRQRITADYNETSTSSITFTYPLEEGDEVDVYAGLAVGNLVAAAASSVALTDAGDYYIGTTVESVLQELAEGVSADRGDADATFTNGSSDRVQRWNTPLSANRTLTLSASNAKEGATCIAVRQAGATGNFSLSVGGLASLVAPGEWAMVKYDATTAAWILVAYGRLPAAGVQALGTNVGDADATLTVGSSRETQRWGSALTTERSANLATAGAWAGARFKIIRQESATGNFSLNVVVGGTRLIRLAPGQWCTVESDGTTWILTGSGDLRPGLNTTVRLLDDFCGEEIDGYRWQSIVGTDAECRAATVRADQPGGVIRLTTGDDAAASMAVNGVQLHSQLNWRPNKGGLVFECAVALDVITNVALFVGLTDQRSALEIPFTLAGGDVLTSDASDAVGVLFDTNATTDRWFLVGVKADVDATKQDTQQAPLAGTFETWRIELDANGEARFYRNGTLVGTAMTDAVTASAQLTPVVAAFARAAASRNIDVDLLDIRAQR